MILNPRLLPASWGTQAFVKGLVNSEQEKGYGGGGLLEAENWLMHEICFRKSHLIFGLKKSSCDQR